MNINEDTDSIIPEEYVRFPYLRDKTYSKMKVFSLNYQRYRSIEVTYSQLYNQIRLQVCKQNGKSQEHGKQQN